MHRILDASSSIPPGLCALGIMTKAPRAGAVKTRLQPPLSAAEAAALNVCFLRDTAAAISAAGERTQGVGIYTPVGAEAIYENILPADFVLMPQREGDFGERLTSAVDDLLHAGFASACLIDSDSPMVTTATFARAADALQKPGERIVLGPSSDGGYYLIGMKTLQRALFERIDWSTERVLAQTIDRARECGVEVELLPEFFDVDDRATLRRLCDELLNTKNGSAPATKNYLEELIAREGRDRIWPEG